MKYSFLKDFRMAPTTGPIASEAVRFELHAAIRTGDPAMFRETLARVAPELAGERRLFCIFEKRPEGISLRAVTELGETPDSSYQLRPESPIDFLNVRFLEDGIEAIIDGERWKLPG